MTMTSPEQLSSADKEEKRQGSGRIRRLLLLALAAGVIYWIYPGTDSEPVNNSGLQPDNSSGITLINRTPGSHGETAADGGVPIAASPTTPASSGLTEGAAARNLIATARRAGSAIDYNALFLQAEEFKQQGKETDAFLLLFFTAREGHGQSALKLGEMNDPALFNDNSKMLDKADSIQAYKWYTRASDAGVAEAGARLSLLRNTTETAAASGDLKAQRLLLNWK